MKPAFELSSNDPEEFQEQISPLVGPNRVRAAKGQNFDIRLKAIRLHTLGLFTVKSPSLKVDHEPPLDNTQLTIPLGKPFSVAGSNGRSWFYDEAHLPLPDQPFYFEGSAGCHRLVARLDNMQFADYAFKLNGAHRPFESALPKRISLPIRECHTLFRGLARLWSDLQCGDSALASAISAAEIEDALISRQKMSGSSGTTPSTVVMAASFIQAYPAPDKLPDDVIQGATPVDT